MVNIEKVNMNGWLNVNKPSGISSSDVVNKVKKKLGFKKRIGHLGTLDPLATGVLPIALGEATKTINYISYKKKKYSFEIKWGIKTETGDEEGMVINEAKKIPDKKALEECIKKNFLGKIRQTPPKYSAVKIRGVRAYTLARKNIDFKIEPKEIEIYNFIIKSFEKKGITSFEVLCSPGTYIRSLANDLAEKLGTYGHTLSINRLSDSFFKIGNAVPLKDLLEEKEVLNEKLLPVDYVLYNLEKINIENKYSEKLKNGIMIKAEDINKIGKNTQEPILLKNRGRVVSIANLKKGYIIPCRNFNY